MSWCESGSRSPFRAYLRNLPNEIAQAADAGLPIVLSVERPLPPHAQRLMDSLGVDVVVTEPAGAVTCPVKLCGWVYDGPADEAGEWLAAHLKLMHASPRAGLGERAVRSSGPDTARSPSTGRRERRGATPERVALAARAQQLRAQGKKQREVAAELGVSRSYAVALMSGDPLGEKAAARKASYRGVCVECGGLTDGSNGRNNPERCAKCAAERQHEERYWTPATIVAAFQQFAQANGRGPTVTDRMIHAPSIRAKLSPERIADAERAIGRARLPNPRTVVTECGSWAAALEAAGLPPSPLGAPSHRAPRRNIPKGASMARIYHVLHRNGDGGLHDTTVEAYSAENAIEKAADSEGEWIAVLDSHWVTASTEQRQVFAVVKPST